VPEEGAAGALTPPYLVEWGQKGEECLFHQVVFPGKLDQGIF